MTSRRNDRVIQPPPIKFAEHLQRCGAGVLLILLAFLLTACNRQEQAHEHAAPEAAGDQLYQCSMHPSIVSKTPGACPICGMDLQPVRQSSERGIPGRAPVDLSQAQQQLVNIRVAPVQREPAAKIIRPVGVITYDETQVSDLTSRIMGWVEQLYVDKPGQFVEKGQRIMALYSPELYSAQQEYLQAYSRAQQRSGAAPELPERLRNLPGSDRRPSPNLLQSARKRLQLWGISPEQIQRLEETGEATETLELNAPRQGHVIEKNVLAGQMIQPGMRLYRIADLSKVWVEAQLYEYELPLVQVGQKATVSVEAHPGREFEGEIDFIYPYLDTATRTRRLRLVFPNKEFLLQPGLYASARIQVNLGNQLLVPARSVFDTGKRQYVFVRRDEGVFVPVLVELGTKVGDSFVVLRGLEENEQVVVDGTFLLDSESQLKAVASGEAAAAPIDAKISSEDFPDPVQLPIEAAELYRPLLENYLTMAKALAEDDLGPAAGQAEKIQNQVQAIIDSPVKPRERGDLFQQQLQSLKEQAEQFRASDLETARVHFGRLSGELIPHLSCFPPPMDMALHIAHCPMWTKSPPNWIQTDKEIENPYMGQKMLRCGEILYTIQPKEKPSP